MNIDDVDMLDDESCTILVDPQCPEDLEVQYNWNDDDDDDDVETASIDFALPSSPMSMSDDYLDITENVVQMVDEDATTHRLGTSEVEAVELSDNIMHAGLFNSETTGQMSDVPTASLGTHTSQDLVISQIEAIFETIADAILAERKELSIDLTANRLLKTTDYVDQKTSRSRRIALTFPGRSAKEAWKFTVVLRILELMHQTICGGTVMTKRDLYYHDPALFGKQSVVDRYVDQVTRAFGVPRASVNIAAAAKGLMAGAAMLMRRDGSTIDAQSSNEGILVSNLDEIVSVDLAAQWVIVIEKEATFQSIISSVEWQSLRWQGVLMTGKGYPDIATRAMVRFLARTPPRNGFAAPKVYGLMDFDPDGVAILNTYKHGSLNLVNENASLVVPEMQWLGLKSCHISDEDQTHRNQGLLPLTKRDRHKARNMLDQAHVDNVEEWRGQLQVMLMLNVKAELQILDAAAGALIQVIREAVQ